MPHRVAVLALDGVKPFDLGIPAQIFGYTTDPSGEPLYSVATCALGGRPLRTTLDFMVAVEHDETLLARADTVVIATQDHLGPLPGPGGLSGELAQALDAVPSSTRIASLCTSAFVLAAAGLLDGYRATTHWALCDEFARRFPRVDVDPNVLFVDNGRVMTAAGAAAGIDLMLHLVRRDHGSAVATAAARRSVVAPWRDGGQAQFIEHPVPTETAASTSRTRRWALDQISEPLTLQDMAQHAHTSVRTFTRRFRAEVGQSPHQWITQQRIARARDLLESTNLTANQVAAEVGFSDAVLLRKHLKLLVGLSPSAYRRSFSNAAQTPKRAEPSLSR